MAYLGWSGIFHVFGAVAGRCERKGEGCAVVNFSIGPDAAAVFFDNALNRGEPYSVPFEILGAVQPLKNTEQLVTILRIEAGSVVANEDHGIAVKVRLPNLDEGSLPASGVFDGIGEQVHEYQLHKPGIALQSGQ